MKKDKKALYAYAAGIVDGEGSFCLHHSPAYPKKRLMSEVWYPEIIVAVLDGKITDFLSGLLGGFILWRGTNPSIKNKNEFGCFMWKVRSEKAAITAEKILPFLKTKKKQAELIIRFQERIKVGRKKFHGGRLPVHEVEKRRQLAQDLKELNSQTITIPKAGLETEQIEAVKERLTAKRQSTLARNFK